MHLNDLKIERKSLLSKKKKNLLGKLARVLVTLNEVILLLVFKNLIHNKNIFKKTEFQKQS